MPVIGVIKPGARAAIAAGGAGPIGVIGTAGTIASNAYARAIAALAPGAPVVQRACPLFVPLVEEGWFDHPATELVAAEYLALAARRRESGRSCSAAPTTRCCGPCSSGSMGQSVGADRQRARRPRRRSRPCCATGTRRLRPIPSRAPVRGERRRGAISPRRVAVYRRAAGQSRGGAWGERSQLGCRLWRGVITPRGSSSGSRLPAPSLQLLSSAPIRSPPRSESRRTRRPGFRYGAGPESVDHGSVGMAHDHETERGSSPAVARPRRVGAPPLARASPRRACGRPGRGSGSRRGGARAPGAGSDRRPR